MADLWPLSVNIESREYFATVKVEFIAFNGKA